MNALKCLPLFKKPSENHVFNYTFCRKAHFGKRWSLKIVSIGTYKSQPSKKCFLWTIAGNVAFVRVPNAVVQRVVQLQKMPF